MQQKNIGRLIYKLDSKMLKRANWELDLPLFRALATCPEVVVTINDSQCLRFIDELTGVENVTAQAKEVQRQIKYLKRMPKSRETKKLINTYYDKLYDLQFQPNYVCVVMNSMKDYDRANEGFSIRFGDNRVIHYRRFLGTNGGIKNSTIVYVNRDLYPALKERLDCGRDKTKELVPAKLEAYQALICSGSIPLPKPKGFIVVSDCITHFKEDVIKITDDGADEPVLTHEHDYEFEHNNSDGYGFMLPSYSRLVNEYLTSDGEHTIAGMNTRYAWTKGMVYTFDFVEFAERVAGDYYITDVWGDRRDVRDAEVILTESMLKLWDSYSSWEDYQRNCDAYGYQFSATKTTPQQLEHVRDMNYQFLQSYDFTDEEIAELCQPTVDEIKDVAGLDYRKSIVFLSGFGLNDRNVWSDMVPDCAKALMADPDMIKDPFIRRKIYNAIKTRITAAKRGCIRVDGNYAMIAGDLYALAQHMLGLEVTGLLHKGEVYHKYWIDKGADEIVCFRAPMTAHNNIRRMQLNKSDEVYHWFQYVDTALIYNAWDSSCEAMNGADFDGDSNMCTDNPILLRNTRNSPTIVCVQRRAEKCIPTEEDIIHANKLAFNDDIGKITNYITSMFDVQSRFKPGSKEYEEMEYRIMCGQLFQQNTIDRAKGIIAKPMPAYWYAFHACAIKDEDDAETVKRKEHWIELVADKKPYFMVYVYPALKKEMDTYQKENKKYIMYWFSKYGIYDWDDLQRYEPKTVDMILGLDMRERFMPVNFNQCTMNRITQYLERQFHLLSRQIHKILNSHAAFDYSALQSSTVYFKPTYNHIAEVYQRYMDRKQEQQNRYNTARVEGYDEWMFNRMLADYFISESYRVCTNEDELCNIVVDICYRSEQSKQFAWDMCAPVMLSNLLNLKGQEISYPALSQDKAEADFEYAGQWFKMTKKDMGGMQ